MSKKNNLDFATNFATKTKSEMVKYEKKHAPIYKKDTKRPYVYWYAYFEEEKKFIRVVKYPTKDMTELDIKNLMQEVRFAQAEGLVYQKSEPREINPETKKKPKKVFTLQKMIDDYLSVKILELKPNSQRSYKSHLGLFVEWCHKNNIINIKDISNNTIKDYLLYTLKIGNSHRNRNNKRLMLKTFFNSLEKDGIIKQNPVSGILKLKQDTARIGVIQKEHVEDIWRDFKRENEPLYYFTRIIFYSFMRTNELSQLKVGDIDFQTKKITINAKISKTGLGYVFITSRLEILLKELIGNKKPNQWLFEKETGERYTAKWMSEHFLKYRIRKQYPDTYKLYSFKHTGVKEHFLEGNTIQFISKQCRHTNIAMTFHYLERGLGIEINPNYNYLEPKFDIDNI